MQAAVRVQPFTSNRSCATRATGKQAAAMSRVSFSRNVSSWKSSASVACPRLRAISLDIEEAVQPADNDEIDFYSLFGLPPNATGPQIKSAYRRLMRDLHPDLAAMAGPEAQEQANQLAAMLNEIYETLSDPDKRALYDALSGFAMNNSVNPFVDTSFERDQVFVDEITCIGCGKCVRQCPTMFEIEESKYGRARCINQQGGTAEEAQIAMEVCPVSCIYWVTLPQLSLLEGALAVMPRVDVWLMQRSAGSRAVGNVFEEGYKSYEKRRMAINAKAAAAAGNGTKVAGIKIDWSFWSSPPQDPAAGSSNGNAKGQANSSSSTTDPDSRRIAGLAAATARAARLWRAYGGGRSARGVSGHLESSSSASSMDMEQ